MESQRTRRLRRLIDALPGRLTGDAVRYESAHSAPVSTGCASSVSTTYRELFTALVAPWDGLLMVRSVDCDEDRGILRLEFHGGQEMLELRLASGALNSAMQIMFMARLAACRAHVAATAGGFAVLVEGGGWRYAVTGTPTSI